MAKHFVNIIFTFILILLLSSEVYSQGIIVSTPKPIDNVIDMQNPNDYALYEVDIYNYLNTPINFRFTDVSFWSFVYSDKAGTIEPLQNKSIYIKMRPISDSNELPVVALKIYYDNYTRIYYLSFSPIVIRKNYTISGKKSQKLLKLNSITIEPKEIQAGKNVKVLLNISSPDYRTVKVRLCSDAFFQAYEIELNVSKGDNIYIIDIPISGIIQAGEYEIVAKLENYTKTTTIYVKSLPLPVKIEKKKDKIIIKNVDLENPVFYSYKMKVSLFDAIFKEFKPAPSYYITTKEGTTYAVWDVILFPTETYTISINTNKTNIVLLTIIVVLSLALVIIKLIYPKIEVKKEIIRIDTHNKTVRILISIANKGRVGVKDIKIEDTIINLFRYKASEFIKPVGVVEEGNNIKITWYIDRLQPGEERVIVYTLKYETEPVGNIKLDPVRVTYKAFNRTFMTISNTLLIRFAKPE